MKEQSEWILGTSYAKSVTIMYFGVKVALKENTRMGVYKSYSDGEIRQKEFV
jgi:hypothetical protein